MDLPWAYVAGPMRGLAKLNFPAFIKAGNILRNVGFHVINPAEMDLAAGIDPDEPDLSPHSSIRDCMERDTREICRCDYLFLLPGWEKSRGTWVELVLAMEIGVVIQEIYKMPDAHTGMQWMTITHQEIYERTRAMREPWTVPTVREQGQPGELRRWLLQVFQHGLWLLGIPTGDEALRRYNKEHPEVESNREPILPGIA